MMRSWKGWNPVPTKSESPLTTATTTTGKDTSVSADGNGKINSSSRRGGHNCGKCVNVWCIIKVALVSLFGIGLAVGLAVYFSGNSSQLFNIMVHPPAAPPPASPGKTNSSFQSNLTITTNDTSPSSSTMLDINATIEEMKNRQVAVLEDLNLITQSTSLLTPGTPQHSAAEWIIYKDPLQLVPSEDYNFRQRYTLAVLYFSLIGNRTKDITFSGDPGLDNTWLSPQHECDWKYVECSSSTLEQLTYNGSTTLSSVNVVGFYDILTNESTIHEDSMTDDKLVLQPNGNADAQKVVTSLEMDKLNLTSKEEDAPYSSTIPSEITTLFQLNSLRLASNKLVGTLPVNLGRLSHLGTRSCKCAIGVLHYCFF
jgi:hypothetical protein